jgi:hypothetical protein
MNRRVHERAMGGGMECLMQNSRKRQIAALLIGNGLIAGYLILPDANAQPANRGDTARARGDYTMVSGRTNQGGPSVVYIVDSSNQELVALRWDQTKKVMGGVGYRNLAADSRGAKGR